MESREFLTQEKRFEFAVSETVPGLDSARDRLSGTRQEFNRTLSVMNQTVGVLDRYDDFSSLKINIGNYGVTAFSGAYGIPEKDNNDPVIYPHQEKAARSFLRELRGFGLLADVVGSGKTYEAGVILSELAVRGKVESMLVIVPEQVYGAWIKVLEQDFGLGKDVLFRANMQCLKCGHRVEAMGDGLIEETMTSPKECPKCGASLAFNDNHPAFREGTKKMVTPVIVKMEDFAEWDNALGALFDVIVVDEAHNLCQQDGVYSKTMKLLSELMITKKKANNTYCVLLSATPHSGNLENMFRLWYFIRCKGGNPADFDLVEQSRSTEYHREKQHYIDRVCHGSNTVMEFIQNVKEELITDPTGEYYAAFVAYLAEKHPDIDLAAFRSMTRGERRIIITEFLRKNAPLKAKVERRVANEYHNGLLRSIMIRGAARIAKKKSVRNVYFYPVNWDKLPSKTLEFEGFNGERAIIHVDKLGTNEAVVVDEDKMSLDAYIATYRGNRDEIRAKAQLLISKVFNETVDTTCFVKQDVPKYYWEQFEEVSDTNTTTDIIPFSSSDVGGIQHKLDKLLQIIEEHKGRRILIFFDYDLRKDKQVADQVEAALCAVPALKKRILVGNVYNKRKVVEQFHANDDAILIIKDAAYTEGVNLQCCNVIVNFQVSPDPLSMDQRVGRIFRLGQRSDVYVYSLADMNELEGFALAYYGRIGLLSSNSGDATIIAGSNNECMRTIRCHVCGNVELLSQEDYELRRQRGDMYCTTTPRCVEEDPRGTVMEEICVYDFKCDRCGSTFTRSSSPEGYLCISRNNDTHGVMCSQGNEGDRAIYCSKICAMAHCKFFDTPAMRGKCKVLEYYRRNPETPEADLMTLCAECTNPLCREECKFGTGPSAVEACMTCNHATCSPKPYRIEFNDRWEGACPSCAAKSKHGIIKPVVARTFAAYLRSLWDFNCDGGKGFCLNLLQEANKVAEIKTILGMDGEE